MNWSLSCWISQHDCIENWVVNIILACNAHARMMRFHNCTFLKNHHGFQVASFAWSAITAMPLHLVRSFWSKCAFWWQTSKHHCKVQHLGGKQRCFVVFQEQTDNCFHESEKLSDWNIVVFSTNWLGSDLMKGCFHEVIDSFQFDFYSFWSFGRSFIFEFCFWETWSDMHHHFIFVQTVDSLDDLITFFVMSSDVLVPNECEAASWTFPTMDWCMDLVQKKLTNEDLKIVKQSNEKEIILSLLC